MNSYQNLGFAVFTYVLMLPAFAAAAPPPSLQLTGTIRDFKDTHPDFEKFIATDPGIVTTSLGADGKPVYAGQAGNPTTHGQAAFDQWYRDVPGVNMAAPFTITLAPVPGSPNLFSYQNSSFFPIDNQLFGNQGRNHNFHFTYEINSQFTYQGGEVFTFTGDDDLWVYIAGKQVIDLGGVHGPMSASINLDNLAPSLGLTLGGTYPFDLFFAERHTSESNFKITTTFVLLQESCDNGVDDDDNGLIDCEDPVCHCNECPTADAGPATVLECTNGGAEVVLDGSGSSDPDGDALSFSWSVDDGAVTAEGAVATVDLSLGLHTAVLTVADEECEATDETAILIADTQAPSATCPGDEALALSADTCEAAASYQATATDACVGAINASHVYTFSAPGSQSHTYNLNDASGNAASCTQTVTAVDVTAPGLSCPEDAALLLDPVTCAASATFTATAQDACSGPFMETFTYDLSAPGVQSHVYSFTDESGNVASCSQYVTASDVTAPVFTPSQIQELWPPNHKYVTISLAQCGTVTDNCGDTIDLTSSAAQITSVSSDEPEDVDGNGDGKTFDDIVIVDAHTVNVRSERQGGGDGRVYSIGFNVADGSGNVTQATCLVGVPHDQGQHDVPMNSGAAYTVP